LADLAESFTPYQYVKNNPFNRIDPTGMWTTIPGGITTNDPDEIAAFLQQQKTKQNKKDQDKDKDNKKKEANPNPDNYPVLKTTLETGLSIRDAINYYNNILGGPEGSAIDKLIFWTKIYLYGKILSLFGDAISNNPSQISKGELKPSGFGSTGRIIANNEIEANAMERILGDPTKGSIIERISPLKDTKWEGWRKMYYEYVTEGGNKAQIHYNALFDNNGKMIAVDDFKFK
jgi:hypothetical protein